jgi:hypothetical protein
MLAIRSVGSGRNMLFQLKSAVDSMTYTAISFVSAPMVHVTEQVGLVVSHTCARTSVNKVSRERRAMKPLAFGHMSASVAAI